MNSNQLTSLSRGLEALADHLDSASETLQALAATLQTAADQPMHTAPGGMPLVAPIEVDIQSVHDELPLAGVGEPDYVLGQKLESIIGCAAADHLTKEAALWRSARLNDPGKVLPFSAWLDAREDQGIRGDVILLSSVQNQFNYLEQLVLQAASKGCRS